MKIVINSEIGGFSVTRHIAEELAKREVQSAIEELELMEGDDLFQSVGEHYPLFGTNRADPRLIDVIEKWGIEVPHLAIINIPDDVDFYIHENEMGVESVHEKHRVWQFTVD